MIVNVLEDAAEDIDLARRFYESKEAGVGDYFVESILSDLDSLVLYAGVHQKQFGFYRMLARRFPFAIYYALEHGETNVYAILDLRRNPLWVRKELQGRRE